MLTAAVAAAAAAALLLPQASGPSSGNAHRLPRIPGVGLGRSRRPPEADAAVLLDLTAALLNSGVGVEAALQRLADTVSGAEPLARVHHTLIAGGDWRHAAELVEDSTQLRVYCQHLSFAYATGAPSASMLEASAEHARRQRRQDSARRAEELGVKMMLPLGVCFLPAFILVGIIPVVLSMLPEALGLADF